MKRFQYIYTEGTHKWAIITQDPERANYIIDTNEYILQKEENFLLTDPGGIEIFPAVFSSLSSELSPSCLEYIFSSHQDPDIISSLSLWLDVSPSLKCFVSRLWVTFLPHFGGNSETFISIPDKGMNFNFRGVSISFIPAHYLHSAGNFHLYDEKAKILFSGDVGAALLPETSSDIFVKDFDSHIRYAKGFHERWMGSNESKREWCEKVSKLKIDMLCPQHGLIYTGANIERFINWFYELPVGIFSD
ncbi:MAG: MBL fold metallo-hydrolase [Leptospiraceae bacterium]|nr:MBL fold metallo-hydrolase [Leptospiraceae bacterium]